MNVFRVTNQLRAKVSNLEAERENLLAVIQLLTEEKQTVSNSQTLPVNTKAKGSNIESNSDGVEDQDGPWLKVGKNGKENDRIPLLSMTAVNKTKGIERTRMSM